MFYTFLLTVHVIACFLMILVVLLQTGRGAGLLVFGGGGDSLINTPTGSSFMRKLTSVLAGTFALTSLLLTFFTTRSGMSTVTSRAPTAPAPVQAPRQSKAPVPPPHPAGTRK
ncbi:MAG: preprotein translocase subunit SecG [Elusimicrobia bacterium]|nr:preprotein translocase subunit SecG [Elusimicrobiota bacterium]